MKRFLSDSLASWFGCGFVPVAPGTVGSMGALAAAWVLTTVFPATPAWMLGWAFLLLPPGLWAADTSARLSGQKDPQFVVVDEVLGQWITLAGAAHWGWKAWLAAFALFRLFDIWKPAPARRLEAMPGGAGIIADDIMAGLYGALVMFVAGWWDLY